MGLPSLLTDPQFLYFAHLLRTNPRDAYGYLDYGWLIFNISGDPHYQDKDQLEGLLHWEGKRGALADAMLKAGFLKRRGKTGYTIADAEQRLQEWGRKRMQRREEARQTNGAAQRRSAPKHRPTDPDPDNPIPKGKIITLDHDQVRGNDRDRPKTAAPDTRSAIKNPREAAQELVQQVSGGLKGLGVRQTRQSAPPPEQQIGSYSAKDCALAAASYDRGNDHDSAVAMWTVRAAQLSQYRGGLDYFRDLLTAVHNARHPELRKGVGTIHNAGAYLNRRTAEWLAERQAS